LTTAKTSEGAGQTTTVGEGYFISYDPLTYRGLIDIVRFTEKHGDEITKEVVFNQVGVSLEGPS